MTITRLTEKRFEKVWGRRDLPEMFGGTYEGGEPLGEIWFELPSERSGELLIKYLFTSERLSIQVHPDDEAARRAGLGSGKDEAWIILKAEPGATIGLGLREAVTREELREAALDGSIEELVDWRSVKAGEIIYSPARTVHALGPGLVLIEVQQNSDITYRLYDYGRPRPLHLGEGIEIARRQPYTSPTVPFVHSPGREILAHGGAFVLEQLSGSFDGMLHASTQEPLWLIPVGGDIAVGGEALRPGSVWHSAADAELSLPDGAELYMAYPGHDVRDSVIVRS